MSSRITRKQIEYQFERTCKALGRPINSWRRTDDGRNVATVGALVLSKEFHSYQIHQIMNEGGGVSVVGSYGLDAWSMYVALRMLEEAPRLMHAEAVYA